MKYLAPIPKQFVDQNGLPLSNGTVHVYISGDTQYANVYQDADGEELMPNPARLDSNGAWLGFVTAGVPLDYVVEDKEGNVQFEYEKVVAGSGTANVAIEPVLTSGTKIAECWVDGELLELFAPDDGGTQVQADWNENDSTAPSYIKNKPTIPTADIKYTDSWAHTNAERDDSGGIPDHLDFLLIQGANCAGFKGVDVWCAFNMYWEADGTFPAGNIISVRLMRNGVSCGGHELVYWPAEPGGYVEPNGRQNMLRVHLTGLSNSGSGDWYVRFTAADEDSLPPRFINGVATLINGLLFNE